MEKFKMKEFFALSLFIKKSLARYGKCDLGEKYDFYFEGLSNHFFTGPCFIEVCWNKQRNQIDDKIHQIEGDPSKDQVVLVCNLDEKDIHYNSNKVKIVGYEFIKYQAKKDMDYWWDFVASCADCPEVSINENEGKLFINWLPNIVKELDIYPEIKMKDIDQLSNKHVVEFKRRTLTVKKPSVIIGNGVSIPFGSDPWSKLSDYLFDYLSPKYVDNSEMVKIAIGNSTFSSTSMSRTTINKKKYNVALHACIYRKYEEDMHTDSSLLRAIVDSKINHENLELITYNYDEFLEKDYFFKTNNKMKSVISSRTDKKTSEPKVKHIHGLIRYNAPQSATNIVLTQEEYYKSYKGKSWTVSVQKQALNGLCLYVGSSMSDLFQMSLINDVRTSNEKSGKKDEYNEPWSAYALMCFNGLSERDIVSVYNYYLRMGVRVIFVKKFSELATKYTELMNY